MIPMRHSTIFKNRWFALLWAAGICWMAVSFAGRDESQGDEASNKAAAAKPAGDDAEIKALKATLKRVEQLEK